MTNTPDVLCTDCGRKFTDDAHWRRECRGFPCQAKGNTPGGSVMDDALCPHKRDREKEWCEPCFRKEQRQRWGYSPWDFCDYLGEGKVMDDALEPTQAQLDAALDELTRLYRGGGGWIGKEAAYEQARITWRAMIAALTPIERPKGCDLHPQGGFAWCEDCLSGDNAWLEARIQQDAVRIERYEERLAETQMLAFKWMEAHDKLKAGKPYSFPKPADLPEALAKARTALGHSRGAIASLDEGQLGYVEPQHEDKTGWPVQAELLHMIDEALTSIAEKPE